MSEAWNSYQFGKEGYKLLKRLYCTSKALQIWNREKSGFTHKRIKALEEELLTLQRQEDKNDAPSKIQIEVIEEL